MAENQPPDERIRDVYIKCGHCDNRFKSPIFIGSTRAFESAVVMRNATNCPKCGGMIHCDKTNMSYITEGGRSGAVGDDFSGNKL